MLVKGPQLVYLTHIRISTLKNRLQICVNQLIRVDTVDTFHCFEWNNSDNAISCTLPEWPCNVDSCMSNDKIDPDWQFHIYATFAKQIRNALRGVNPMNWWVYNVWTLRPRQACRHFRDGIFKWFFLKQTFKFRINCHWNPVVYPLSLWVNRQRC